MFENETLDWNRNNCWRVFSTLSHFQFQHQPQMIKTESHDQSKVDRNTTGGCPNSAGCRHGNQGGRDPGRRAGKAGRKWASTTGGQGAAGTNDWWKVMRRLAGVLVLEARRSAARGARDSFRLARGCLGAGLGTTQRGCGNA